MSFHYCYCVLFSFLWNLNFLWSMNENLGGYRDFPTLSFIFFWRIFAYLKHIKDGSYLFGLTFFAIFVGGIKDNGIDTWPCVHKFMKITVWNFYPP